VKRLLVLLVSLAACSGRNTAPPAHHAAAGDVAVVGVTVVPMDREGTLADQTVVVRGDRIVLVEPSRTVDVGKARVIDGHGRWLLPGLADMHVHLWGERDLPLFLWNGVTTVRNMFGAPTQLTWREKIAKGELDGPTLLTAGPILDGDPPVWPGSVVVTTPDAARAVVRDQKRAGYDLIKVYNGLASDVYDAIVDEAKAQGILVGGHVPKAVGLERALTGQRTIEHLDGYIPFGGDPKVDAATVAATVEAGVWNCPTLVVTERFSHMDDLASLAATRGLDHVTPEVRAMWDPKKDFRLARWTPEMFAKSRERNQVRRTLVGDLSRAGAHLVLGTDTGNPFVIPGFAVHDELGLLVASGLTPWQALHSATAAAAEMLGTPGRFGVVAPGARADLILVDRDPLADVRAVADPPIVIVRGTVRTRDELGAAVTATEKKVRDWRAELEAITADGTPVLSADYAVKFADTQVGVERAVLSRAADGTRVVQGHAVYDDGNYRYRATRSSLRLTTDKVPGEIAVSLDPARKLVVATTAGGTPIELAAGADTVVAPQTIAELFWYADALADLAIGGQRAIDAAEVMTDGALRLDPAHFTFTRRPDDAGKRVYDIAGTHGKLQLTGKLVVDPDGAPAEVTMVLRFGTVVFRRM